MKIIAYVILLMVSFCFLSTAKNAPAFTKPSLVFTQNKGQITDQYGKPRHDIDFKLENSDVLIFVGKGELHYQFMQPVKNDKGEVDSINTYRLDVKLLGANQHPLIIAEQPEKDFDNYYLPQCPDGVTAHRYRKVIYKDVYPHIDWEIELTPLPSSKGEAANRGCKYNFIVQPGGDYRDIKIQYNGATAIALKDGALMATTPMGSITENMPYTYDTKTKREIASNYVLNGNILTYNISFPLGEDRDGAFVIDPAVNIDWATYYGGTLLDRSGKMTVDLQGNAYICGITNSSNNIATSGTYQSTLSIAFAQDALLAKFNSAGQRLWGTYYGGSGPRDYFTSVVYHKSGNLYVAGQTENNGLVTSGAYQAIISGGYDALLVSMDPTNGTRRWATYYGGNDSDFVTALTCDSIGNIIMGGFTESSNGIATTGSYNGGSNDAFIAKFGSGGNRIWGKYFGGANWDDIAEVATDLTGNIYFAGTTSSTGGISTVGAHQFGYGGGSFDGFLGQYDGSGNLQWATYYGGSGDDYAGALSIDKDGSLYIGGESTSATNIATPGSYLSASPFPGGGYGYFAKFNGAGSRVWGTWLDGRAVASIAAYDKIYLCGNAGFNIATPDAYKLFHQTTGGADAYFMIFDLNGNRQYGSYFGGNYDESMFSIKISPCAKFLFNGHTGSTSGLAYNAFQSTYGGGGVNNGGDLYLASFMLDTMSFFPLPYTDTLFCAGDSVHIAYGVNTKFNSSNIFTLQMSNASGSFASPVNIATKASDTAGIFNGQIPISTAGGTGYRFRIISSSPVRISDRDTLPIHIKPVAASFSASSNTPVCAGDTLRLYGASTTPGLTWNWIGPVSFTSISKDTIIANAQSNRAGDYVLTATLNGCTIRDTETITVKPLPAKPNAGSNTPLCAGSNLNLTATTTTSGVSWNWTGPTSFSSTAQNPTRTGIATADAGNYIVTAILNGCASRDTEAVVINPIPPAPSAGSNSPLCSGNTLTLTASPLSGATYNWTGPGGFGAASQNTSRTNVQVTDAGAYSVTATVNGCTSPAGTVNVTITSGPTVNIYVNPNDTVCAGTPVTLVALPLNGGTTPQIKWYRNGNLTSVTTGTYVVSTPVNNDVFYCELTNNTTCAVPATANSNSLTLTVLPVTPPSVTVSPTFTTPQNPYNLLTFTATGTNGGSNPQYQWIHNHQLVAGATGSTWSTQGLYLSQFDTICVIMTSSEICANPKKDTACTAVQILLGVEDVNKSNIEVYPNPNDGRFTINATGIRCGKVFIELYNAVGQLVHRQSAEVKQGRIHENVDLGAASAGLYMLRMKGEGVSFQSSVIKR